MKTGKKGKMQKEKSKNLNAIADNNVNEALCGYLRYFCRT